MLYAIAAVLAIILDQAVKYWTTVNIVVDTGEAKLLPGLLHLANVHNTGAAFSFLEGARWFFVILCIVFVLVVVYALAKDFITHPVCRWAAVFVLAGAVGNCIDRIVCGFVVDMLEFDFLIFKRPFPVFNVADIYITVGVIVFCIALLLEKPAGKQPAGAAGEETAAEAPAPAEKSTEAPAHRTPLRHRQKLEIPTFPRHDLPEVPVMDPNDPFAEWEKRANASDQTPAAPTAAPSGKTVYTQPAAEPVFPAPAEVPEVAPEIPEPAEKKVPTDSAAPAAPKPEIDEFDLDSILAEFKDL